jgi:hypothetical protein
VLSYYNQPDHENIDRRNEEVKALLLALARSQVITSQAMPHGDVAASNDIASKWKTILEAKGYRLPTKWNVPLGETEKVVAYYSAERVAIVFQSPTAEMVSLAADKGFRLLDFGLDPDIWPSRFAQSPDVFGPGKHS